ncbi:MAG: hypothetical protein N2482_00800 [Patescibacteria group bacterium]|nr:hypothetical protein [Patescibacteria group bacterium]
MVNNNNYTPLNVDQLKKRFATTTFVGKPKEAEPVMAKPEMAEIQEVVEKETPPEVKPYVQKREETIKLPPDLKKLGLQPVNTTNFPQYQNLKLPISDEKIIIGLRAPVSSSLRWLATLAVYLLKMAHIQLKTIHGHIVRVIKN